MVSPTWIKLYFTNLDIKGIPLLYKLPFGVRSSDVAIAFAVGIPIESKKVPQPVQPVPRSKRYDTSMCHHRAGGTTCQEFRGMAHEK